MGIASLFPIRINELAAPSHPTSVTNILLLSTKVLQQHLNKLAVVYVRMSTRCPTLFWQYGMTAIFTTLPISCRTPLPRAFEIRTIIRSFDRDVENVGISWLDIKLQWRVPVGNCSRHRKGFRIGRSATTYKRNKDRGQGELQRNRFPHRINSQKLE